jgi:NADH-ubiquinone oxidoreductase chain 5
MLMSIGFFAIFTIFGSLNYSEVFTLVPYLNETAITIIALLLLGGALAKSANIPLHSWLPGSMEAFKYVCLPHQAMQQLYFIIIVFLFYYNYNSYYAYDINCLTILTIINSIPTATL